MNAGLCGCRGYKSRNCLYALAFIAAVGAWVLPEDRAQGRIPPLTLPATPLTTLTGVLSERIFIQDCHCFPFVIEKNGRSWEANVAAVRADAQRLNGQRVVAFGTWGSYQRDGQRIRFFKVSQLVPA